MELPEVVFCLCACYLAFCFASALYTRVARAAPTRGASINTHTSFSAAPPVKRAGPILLAGFTDVPVSGMPTICTNVSVSPITTPAILDIFSFAVTPKMVKMNINVKTISIIIAPEVPPAFAMPFEPRLPVMSTTPKLTISFSSAAAATAPRICASTYLAKSRVDMRLSSSMASDTAGLIWHPDTPPITYAIATIDRPNARATAKCPPPTAAPRNTALPHPINVNTNVPMNSAMLFFIR